MVEVVVTPNKAFVRLLAIALFVLAAKDFFNFSLYDLSAVRDALPIYIGVIVSAGVSTFLWFFPSTTAKLLYPYPPEEKLTAWDKGEVLTVSFVVLGIYFLFGAVADLFYYGVRYLLVTNADEFPTALDAGFKAGVGASVFQFVLALLLISGASGLKNTLLKVRNRNSEEQGSVQ